MIIKNSVKETIVLFDYVNLNNGYWRIQKKILNTKLDSHKKSRFLQYIMIIIYILNIFLKLKIDNFNFNNDMLYNLNFDLIDYLILYYVLDKTFLIFTQVLKDIWRIS